MTDRHESPRICATCGITFTPRPHATTQKYCDPCSDKNMRDRWRSSYLNRKERNEAARKAKPEKSPRVLETAHEKHNLICDRCEHYRYCQGIVWSSSLLPCQPQEAEITCYTREGEHAFVTG